MPLVDVFNNIIEDVDRSFALQSFPFDRHTSFGQNSKLKRSKPFRSSPERNSFLRTLQCSFTTFSRSQTTCVRHIYFINEAIFIVKFPFSYSHMARLGFYLFKFVTLMTNILCKRSRINNHYDDDDLGSRCNWIAALNADPFLRRREFLRTKSRRESRMNMKTVILYLALI